MMTWSGRAGQWFADHFGVLVLAFFISLVFFVFLSIGPSTALTPDRTWEHLPANAEPVRAWNKMRSYRLGGCLWFDSWYSLDGGYWTPQLDENRTPVTDCGQ